jgi:hypothetical protein
MDTKKLHPDFIEKVKEQTDIIDVVLDYTNLSKVGKEYQGLCPFHNERSPSFSVSPTKNLAHCFGCGWGGNAIKFLMELNRVSFTEAVLDLARRSNIRVQYDDGSYDDDFPAALPKPERKEQIIEASSQPGYDPTKSEGQVTESIFRLLNYPGDAEKARAWLADRGITPDLIRHYRIGFEKRVVTPGRDKPKHKEVYWSVAIFIPVPDHPGRFYVKKRVAPWLVGDERPKYLGEWSQAGVPATIWFTYKGEDPQETFFCEGEWDAIALGELARTRGEKVAVACSTSGCGTVPSQDQLDQLPGKVRIFYDRDEAGVKGSRKLAEALGDRGQVCLVPMPDDCTTKGWDVSNALAHGYQWEDFVKETPTIKSEIVERIVEATENLSHKENDFKEAIVKFKDKNITKEEEEEWKFWQQSKLFTGDINFKVERFNIEIPELGTFLAILSGLGTGKTHFLIHKLLKHYSDSGAISIGHRNSLLLQFCETAGNWYHLQKELKGTKDEILIKDPTSNIACCADSLVHFAAEDFEGKILILDETESIISHLLLSETNVGIFREKVKQKFVEALNRSAMVVCLDGHLTDKTIQYLQGLIINPKKLIKVKNNYKGNRGKAIFYKGAKSGDKFNTRKYDDFINQALNNKNRIVIGADSQKKLEALDKILQEGGKKTLRYDSTAHGTWLIEFLKDPKEYLIKNQIDVFLYSPSGDAGLNIDIKGYFTDLYFLFMGVLTTSSQLQMLGRIRDPQATIHIYCTPQGLPGNSIGKEVLPNKIIEYALEYVRECAKASLKGESKDDLALDLSQKLISLSDDKHFEHECFLKGIEQHERTNLRQCLRIALEKSGYQVQEKWTTGNSQCEQVKNVCQEIAIEKSEKMYSLPTLTPEETESKARELDLSPDDKLAVSKSRLIRRLPGIENATYKERILVPTPQASIQWDTPTKEIDNITDDTNVQVEASFEKPDKEPLNINSQIKQKEIEQLVKQYSNCKTLEIFQQLSKGSSVQEIESAISLQDSNKQIKYLRFWFDSLELLEDVQERLNIPEIQESKITESEYSELDELNQVDLIENHFLEKYNEIDESGVPTEDTEQYIERSVFTAEFIKKIKFDNPAYISQLEKYYLLTNPEIAKKLQQNKWYNKLSVFTDPESPEYAKKLNLSDWKSQWLKIHTLLEMGLDKFLAPNTEWSEQDPKVIEFYNKAKNPKIARLIGFNTGKSKPCEFIGRTVLNAFGLKTESRQVRTDDGSRIRLYSVSPECLNNPIRKAVLESISQRYNDLLAEKNVDFESLRMPQTYREPYSQLSHLHSNLLTKTEGRCDTAHADNQQLQLSLEIFEKSEVQPQQVIELSHLPSDGYIKPEERCSNIPVSVSLEEPHQQSLELDNHLENAVKLLIDAISHGAETIQAVLRRWNLEERWSVLLQLEQHSEEVMAQLITVAPQVWEWAG